jgi:hypothetical protein
MILFIGRKLSTLISLLIVEFVEAAMLHAREHPFYFGGVISLRIVQYGRRASGMRFELSACWCFLKNGIHVGPTARPVTSEKVLMDVMKIQHG